MEQPIIVRNYNSIISEPLTSSPSHGSENNGDIVVNVDEISRPRRGFRWKPTSMREFIEAEKKLLSHISTPYELQFVNGGLFEEPKTRCSRGSKETTVQLWTISLNTESPSIPMVFLHGICLGIGSLVRLFQEVSKHRPVYSLDLPGYGRSSRIKFPKDAAAAEECYVQILETWRSALGIQKMILAGWSFGGFVATSYALQYPERVAHLIGLDPWGYPEKPKKVRELLGMRNPIVIKFMEMWTKRVNLFSFIRVLGPCGPQCTDSISDENSETFESLGEGMQDAINSYVYHCLAKKPTGESAFRTMGKSMVYAKNPLCKRLHLLHPSIPVTIFHPEKTYVPAIPEDDLRSLLGCPLRSLRVQTIPSTNHDDLSISMELANELCAISGGE